LANHYAQDRQAPTVTPFDGMTKTITPTNRHAKTWSWHDQDHHTHQPSCQDL